MVEHSFAIEETTTPVASPRTCLLPTETAKKNRSTYISAKEQPRVRWIRPHEMLGAAILVSSTLSSPSAFAKELIKENVQPLTDTSGPEASDSVSELVAEIDSYRNLQDGWDGPDSIAPTEDAIRDALRFIDMIPDKTVSFETMVAADGEVGLCCADQRLYADIGFRGDGFITFFVRFAQGTAKGHEQFGEALPRKLVHALTD